jgi:hypothetical protein
MVQEHHAQLLEADTVKHYNALCHYQRRGFLCEELYCLTADSEDISQQRVQASIVH